MIFSQLGIAAQLCISGKLNQIFHLRHIAAANAANEIDAEEEEEWYVKQDLKFSNVPTQLALRIRFICRCREIASNLLQFHYSGGTELDMFT